MILGVVQARMASTRLPGKVLAPIMGKPMVRRILDRMLLSRSLDRVVIATTTERSDDELVGFAEREGIEYHRGSVDDIAERLLGAAERFEADVLARIWGDCPFIDPLVIDEAVNKLLAEDLDYVSNTVPGERTFPRGLDVEVYRRRTLESMRDGTRDGFYREFPLEYITQQPDRFRWDVIRNDRDLSHIQLTVDYPQDLELARTIYSALHGFNGAFSYREAVAFMQSHPEMLSASSRLPRNVDYLRRRKKHQ